MDENVYAIFMAPYDIVPTKVDDEDTTSYKCFTDFSRLDL
jgi:hypothetical protein